MATPNTQPPPFKLHDIIITDIIGKLTTMKPYLERSADIELQTQLSKVYKEVDDLYKQWLQGRDIEAVEPPFEEDWDENAESVGDGYESQRSSEGLGSKEYEEQYSRDGSERSAMSVDREMEEEGQEEEENKPEPEDEATQLQDTMQRYFSAANQSVKNPTTYSPPPALSPRPISEHAQTPAPQTQPSFQIKGLASASASTSTSAPTPTPAPAKEISRSMKKKLNRQGGNSTQGQRRTKESRDEEYESKKLQWEQERELGVLREKETRPKAVSAWAPVGEKDAYGNANFGMQKGPYGEGH